MKVKKYAMGGAMNGTPTKAELKDQLERLRIEKRKATMSRDLTGNLMFTQAEEFKDLKGLTGISDKVAAQAEKFYNDKMAELEQMMSTPEMIGGGKIMKYGDGGMVKIEIETGGKEEEEMDEEKEEYMYGGKMRVKKFENGGKMGDGPGDGKFVVQDGKLYMVLGSGKMTESFTDSQLNDYLKQSGFYGIRSGVGAGTASKKRSAAAYNTKDALKQYRDTGDLTFISGLIDTNLMGHKDVIKGLPFEEEKEGEQKVFTPVGKSEEKYGEGSVAIKKKYGFK